ncbi:MAG: hypothetical protein ABIB47_01275 [Candidatus Woesearchaeota archaeon]
MRDTILLIIVIILLAGLTLFTFSPANGGIIGRSVRTAELPSFDSPTQPYDSFYARAKTREFLENKGYVDIHITDMKQIPTDWFLKSEATKDGSSFILVTQVNKLTGDVDWLSSGNEEGSRMLVGQK